MQGVKVKFSLFWYSAWCLSNFLFGRADWIIWENKDVSWRKSIFILGCLSKVGFLCCGCNHRKYLVTWAREHGRIILLLHILYNLTLVISSEMSCQSSSFYSPDCFDREKAFWKVKLVSCVERRRETKQVAFAKQTFPLSAYLCLLNIDRARLRFHRYLHNSSATFFFFSCLGLTKVQRKHHVMTSSYLKKRIRKKNWAATQHYAYTIFEKGRKYCHSQRKVGSRPTCLSKCPALLLCMVVHVSAHVLIKHTLLLFWPHFIHGSLSNNFLFSNHVSTRHLKDSGRNFFLVSLVRTVITYLRHCVRFYGRTNELFRSW